jgi:hypothetical protein
VHGFPPEKYVRLVAYLGCVHFPEFLNRLADQGNLGAGEFGRVSRTESNGFFLWVPVVRHLLPRELALLNHCLCDCHQTARRWSIRELKVLLPSDRLTVRQECGKIGVEEKFVQFDRTKLFVRLAPLGDEQDQFAELCVVRARLLRCGVVERHRHGSLYSQFSFFSLLIVLIIFTKFTEEGTEVVAPL